jgi:hypothetical protein
VVGTYGNIIDHQVTDHYRGNEEGPDRKIRPEKGTETRLRR